ELEEQRLLEMVAGVIENKGKLLIPAFAIGRAQEVILMLLKQFRGKKLASFPVWIDGMVRTICGVYSRFPAHQTPYSRRLIEKHGNPFFNIIDEIRQVASPAEREKVLSGDPCVIIASSGMLTGGASAFYAQHLVDDERNGIAITGYQDEESPGRQLLALAESEIRDVSIAGKTLEVKCGVEKYALSAHADCNEIAGLIEAINPREVVLVHGEGQSRESLRDLLRRQGSRYRPVHLPRTGDTLSFGAARRIAQTESATAQSAIGRGEPLDASGMPRLAQQLREHGDEGRLFTETELLDLWHGNRGWDEEHYGELIKLLDDSEDFRRPKARPHRYRLLRSEEKEAPEEAIVFATPQEILSRVDNLFPAETGLYHKGYDIATHTLRLSFEFPDIAPERYAERLKEIVAGTGWTYTINDKPHQGRLVEVALECLPDDVPLMRAPAVHLETKEVAVKLDALPDGLIVAAAMTAFHDRTGWRLRLQTPQATITPAVEPSAQETTPAPAPQAARPRAIEESELEFRPATGGRPLNEKTATAEIEEAFSLAPETWRPSRVKLKTDEKGDYLELAFLTPELGLRQRRTMQAMADATGHRLRIRLHVNTFDLVEIARKIAPKEWRLLKQPSLHQDQGVVRIKVAVMPPAEELADVCERYDEITGFRLDVTT
ncbi:MAG TPA: MBL fold metallo-hydrolase, partial [Blastocatellia bacterium]|nr:MBL fold metallo-hydrolase [Blastocatellia bacterium]